jgi:hypothetical protein
MRVSILLFIQGAGQGAYEEDKKLAASLREALGPEYEVHYPAMPDEDNAPYEQWKQQIEKELAAMQGSIILIGNCKRQFARAMCLVPTTHNAAMEPPCGIKMKRPRLSDPRILGNRAETQVMLCAATYPTTHGPNQHQEL